MRYSFQLGHRLHYVNLEEHAEGPRFVVDGSTYEPKVQTLGKGHYRVALAGKSYEFHIRNGIVTEGARQLDLEVRRARPELARSKAGARKGDGRIKPPMPGKVVEVKVKEGQTVAAGDVLVVLEAMKMQNDLKAPMAGTVTKVHVHDGTNVEATTVLLEIEPQAAP
ncbi:MAG TPA: biotin/lipoyl-containing protein [Candidatus Thermoplasmatota archaeon]|nr:biotin/lipoyl-containing protein [Candidatus Thermoplasmatota archaeon]